MLGKDNSKFENYVVKHDKKKKWIAIALCVALLTGTGTMYMMNKPATAVTEEGAEDVGMVLNSGSEESVEEEPLTEEISETESSEESGEEDSSGESESSDAASGSESSDAADDSESSDSADDSESSDAASDSESSDAASDSESSDAADDSESGDSAVDENSATDSSEEKDNSENTEASDSADTTDSSAAESASTESSTEKKSNENAAETPANIPDSVDLADYVTETIIERLNEDGKWVVISEDDILPGDKLRVTFNYTMPNEAAASDDIQLDIPEHLGVAESATSDLQDGNGSYEVTDDNKLKIQYSDEYKEEVTGEASKIPTTSSFAFPYSVNCFFRSIVSSLVIVAHAEETTSGSTTVYTTVPIILVDSVSLEKFDKAANTWIPIVTDKSSSETPKAEVSIKNGDALKFYFDYRVPQGSLNSNKREISYTLPAGIKPVETENGNVRDSSGRTVGTYSLDEKGVLTVVFNEDFAEQNKSGDIYGNFYFEGSADFSTEDSESDITYEFGNGVIIVIPKEIEEETTEYDFNISKTGALDNTTNTASYTITVSSTNGSGKEIELRDYLKFYTYDKEGKSSVSTELLKTIGIENIAIRIIKKDTSGKDTDISNEIKAKFVDESSEGPHYAKLETMLPELGAGESYIITYSVPFSSAVTGTHSEVSNYATGKVDSIEKSTDNVTFRYNPYPKIEKAGTYNGETNSIDWEIKINTNKVNLNGYTVTDLLGGKYEGTNYTGKAVLYLKNDWWQDIKQADIPSMPYTFNFDTDTSKDLVYIIKYSTPVKEYQDEYITSLSNYAEITKDGDGAAASQEVKFPTPGGVTKTHTDYSVENGIIDITWKVTILGEINASNWYYYDTLTNGYITETQLNELHSRLSAYNATVIGTVEDGKGYTGFTIKFPNGLDKGKSISFSYHSYGEVSDTTKTYEFKNIAWAVDKKQSTADTVTYKPTVEKYDFITGKEDTKQRDYYSDDLKNEGILSWGFKVIIPEKTDADTIKIVEEMPVEILDSSKYDGLAALSLSTDKEMKSNTKTFDLSSGSGSVNYNGEKISAVVEGKTVTISIPASELANEVLYFCIRGKIADDYKWAEITDEGLNYADFKNKITVMDGNTVIGTSEHTQSVSHNTHALDKWHNEPEDGIVSYSVEVNKFATDLLPGDGNDMLNLVDTLLGTYNIKPGAIVDISIVPGTIKVERIDNNTGKKTELEAGTDYHLTTHSQVVDVSTYSYDDGSRNYKDEEKIMLEVPDEEHLLVTYEYYIRGTNGVSVNVENSATLTGVAQSSITDKLEKPVVIEKSKMTADVNGINLFKVDELDTSKYLEGAKFSLYVYNPDSKENDKYELVGEKGEFVSDSKGFVLLKDPKINGLTLNTAYKIVEEVAPIGYDKEEDPYYFIVINPNASASTYVKPDNFRGTNLFMGENISFTNLPQYSDLKVKKTWNNPDGTADDASGQTYIDVELRRKIGEARVSGDTFDVFCEVRQKSNNWQFGNSHEADVTYGSEYELTMTLSRDYFKNYGNGPMYNNCSASEGAQIIKDHEDAIANDGVLGATVNGVRKKADKIVYDPTNGNITLTYNITITGNTEILAYMIYNASYTYNKTKVGSGSDTSSKSVGLDKHVDDIRIYKENGWAWKNNSYPKFYSDENGLQYYYYYYVVEKTTNSYYEVTYMNNSGISSGTIGIVNTRTSKESYTLPATGSTGTAPFTYGGLGVLGAALIGSAAYNRRRRKRAS